MPQPESDKRPIGAGGGLRPLLALRLAFRQLRRAPGPALFAALTLAVGFGAATAIYSVMRGFDAPLPVPAGQQVVQIEVTDPENGRAEITVADLRAWRKNSRSLQQLGAFSTFSQVALADGRAARLVSGAQLTPAAFEVLRIAPQLGRLPSGAAADRKSIVISDALWRGWLGGDVGAVGTSLRLGDELHTVVGVMPEGFQFPFRQDLWHVRGLDSAAWAGVETVARIDPRSNRTRAGEELLAILTRSRMAANGEESTARVAVHGFTEKRGESSENTMLFGLLLMVLALVIVSGSNVSNLLLERAAARARSLSVHQALGAGPGQIVFQIFTEATLVAALGVVLGSAVAFGAVEFIESTLADNWGYFWMRVRVVPSALALAGLLGVATALISGTLPAWRTLHANIAEPLKQEAKANRGGGKPWASWILMTGQVTFSCMAVIAAVLMGLGLVESRQVEETFPADSVHWTRLTFDGARYEDPQAHRNFRQSLFADLGSYSFVRGAALSTGLPGLHSPILRPTLAGQQPDAQTRDVLASGVTPDFFDVYGIRILDGRGFYRHEAADGVAVVSEDFVRNRLSGVSAIGKVIDLHDRAGGVRSVRIVGVATNAVIYPRDHRRRMDYVYLPIEQDAAGQLYLSVRSDADPAAIEAAIVGAARSADPEVPVGEIGTITEMLAHVGQFMETLGALAILGGLGAMVVVTIGLYGIVSFDVRRRMPEFAIRLALGAGVGNVLGRVLRKGLLLILPGLAFGLGLTFLVTPVLGVFLGGSDAHDPRVFFGVLSIYGLTALLAAGIPARRAAYGNPLDMLREE